ncbi:MAG: YggT family protein [Spirochaetales bacterium]|nr:YggT family protein [Spirochaetales bacterium]
MLKNFTDFLGGAVSIYMFILLIRIMMTWFSPQRANDPNSIFVKLCDPYLNIFRKMGFRFGNVDFSPIVAITLLVIAGSILQQLGIYGTITFGIILSVFVKAFWSAAASLIFFIGIIVLIRLFLLYFTSNTFSPVISSIDAMLVPMASSAASVFFKNAASSYQTNLLVFFGMLVASYFIGNFAVSFLSAIFITIPF